MSFHIPHNVFKVIAMGANDHVDMAGHYTITVNFKTLVFLAMFPTGNHYVLVFSSDKQVYPVYNSKTYKVKLGLMVKFVFGAHYKLKIRDCILFCKKGVNKCSLALQHSGLPV